ncbi:hypothetical protein PSCICG_44550 [Pseudomonas cichorii]|nr:hypothetical protein PSCICG_44550 [Pseudomonas cichorii]
MNDGSTQLDKMLGANLGAVLDALNDNLWTQGKADGTPDWPTCSFIRDVCTFSPIAVWAPARYRCLANDPAGGRPAE